MENSTLTARDFAAEAKTAGFQRNFIGLKHPSELKAALLAADERGESWPSPEWLRMASPQAMRGVRSGWATWQEPAPDDAIELQSEHEQRVACGNRWFLFPQNDPQLTITPAAASAQPLRPELKDEIQCPACQNVYFVGESEFADNLKKNPAAQRMAKLEAVAGAAEAWLDRSVGVSSESVRFRHELANALAALKKVPQ